jgi:hypothetical protein
VDNLKKQHHKVMKRIIVWKDLQPKGLNTKTKTQNKKLKNQKQHGNIQEIF